jgi:hypothetical protein
MTGSTPSQALAIALRSMERAELILCRVVVPHPKDSCEEVQLAVEDLVECIHIARAALKPQASR